MKTAVLFHTFLLLSSILFAQNTPCFPNTDTTYCYLTKKYNPPKQIKLEKKMESVDSSLSTYISPLLSDVNNDCVPDILYPTETNIYRIAQSNGKTLDTLLQNYPDYFDAEPTNIAVADIDGDGMKEVFLANKGGNGPLAARILCYSSTGLLKWVSDTFHRSKRFIGRTKYVGHLGLADFNQDGIPEVYIRNKIFNARTGVFLCDGGEVNGIGFAARMASSVAADFDGDPSDLELAAGYTVYKVKITNPNGTKGNSMKAHNIKIDGEYKDGLTAMGDINGDGVLDVIVHTENVIPPRIPILYAYSFANEVINPLGQVILPPNASNEAYNQFYIGTPSCGIIDNSKKPVILVIRENKLLAYTYTHLSELTLLWTIEIEEGSGATTPTLYDVDGDGINEIIHRDQNFLRIIKVINNKPTVLDSIICHSGTAMEYPLVADVYNDGDAYICTVCTDEKRTDTHLTIFGSPDSLGPWAPARPLWNQYGYHITNINDDLTVPRVQKNVATWQGGRYNGFMIQQSLLDSNGYYRVPAAGLYPQTGCIDYDPVSGTYTVHFSLFNRSDASLTARSGLPVAFYDGDPKAGGALLGVYHTTDDIPAGGSLTGRSFSFSAPPGLMRVYIVINTDKARFSGDNEKDFSLLECDYTDNIAWSDAFPRREMRRDTICAGETYSFIDTVLTDAGHYARSYKNRMGCDSLVVSLQLVRFDTAYETVYASACDSFQWAGQVLRSSGRYPRVLSGVRGCDSTVVLDLTIQKSTSVTVRQTACDSFTWKGSNYTHSGRYLFDTVNVAGCDSSVYLALTLHPSTDTTLSVTACKSYDWHGRRYSTEGTYRFDTLNAYGCPQRETLRLTIADTLRRTDTVRLCEGDSVFLFGRYVKEAMRLSKAFLTPEGCDSLQRYEVLVDPLKHGALRRSICPGDSVFVAGRFFSVPGSYTLTKANAAGCDSVLELELLAKLAPVTYDTLALCEGDTIELFGRSITDEEDLAQHFTAANGCDSLSHVHIALQPVKKTDIRYTLCPGDSLFVAGRWVRSTGVYTETLQAANSCDSVLRYEVAALVPPDSPTARIDCQKLVIEAQVALTAPWSARWDNGDTTAITTYNNTGKATLTLHAAPNCLVSYTINLPPIPDIGRTKTLRDTTVPPGRTVTIDLGLDPAEWSVQWSPEEWVDCDTCMRVTITPGLKEGEERKVTVHLTHRSGCSYETGFLIRIVRQGLYIPNVFTANNDGANDFWTVFPTDNVSILRTWIYDRWGELVFYSGQGIPRWDGRFRGKDAPAAVYVYVVEFRDAAGKVHKRIGDVTLVR